jgi:capsule polysaccharide modification protein KpsS|tara:strand:+ start:3391 stop:4434 length:1044 start_codon:yes stop_codon:yes gene_type:complete
LNILWNFVNNPAAMHSTDYRPTILYPVFQYLKEKGHKVFVDPHKRKGHPSFKVYPRLLKDFTRYKKQRIDLWLTCLAHSPDHQQTKNINSPRYASFKKKGVKIAVYEHAWLPESILVDCGKLFSDSMYANDISTLIEQNFDEQACAEYRNHLLSHNISKRPQDTKGELPDVPYIFVPIQKIEDVSIKNYSPIGMLDFMTSVAKFAAKNKISVVFKPHPHAKGDRDVIKRHTRRLEKEYRCIYCVDAPIYKAMREALFTACVNSGSVIDNIVSQTPVYCCAKSFFYKSDAIVYDKKVGRGLEKIFKQDYDWKVMKMKQQKILWWLRQNLLFTELGIKENTKRLLRHIV